MLLFAHSHRWPKCCTEREEGMLQGGGKKEEAEGRLLFRAITDVAEERNRRKKREGGKRADHGSISYGRGGGDRKEEGRGGGFGFLLFLFYLIADEREKRGKGRREGKPLVSSPPSSPNCRGVGEKRGEKIRISFFSNFVGVKRRKDINLLLLLLAKA